MSSIQLGVQCFPSPGFDTVFSLKHWDIRREYRQFSSPFMLQYPPPGLPRLQSPPTHPQGLKGSPPPATHGGTATLIHHRAPSLLISPFFSLKDREESIFLVNLLQLAALPTSKISCDVTIIFF